MFFLGGFWEESNKVAQSSATTRAACMGAQRWEGLDDDDDDDDDDVVVVVVPNIWSGACFSFVLQISLAWLTFSFSNFGTLHMVSKT